MGAAATGEQPRAPMREGAAARAEDEETVHEGDKERTRQSGGLSSQVEWMGGGERDPVIDETSTLADGPPD